jgi:hypothetical protein
MNSTPALTQSNVPSTAHLLGESYQKAIVEPDGTAGTTWKVDFRLDGGFVRFRALAGVGDKLGAQVAADFSVQGDGRTLFKSSGPQFSGDPPINLDLDVTGVRRLSLIVSDDGSDPFPKEVVWADPVAYPSGAVIPDPPSWPPVQTNPGALAPVVPEYPPTSPAPPVPQVSAPPSSPSDGDSPRLLAPPILDGRTVLVVPFQRVFGFSQASYQVAAEICRQLTLDLHMNVVPLDQEHQALGRANGYLSPDEIRQAAQMVGARYVLMGAIDKYQLPSGGGNVKIYVPFFGIGVRTIDADVKLDFELADASGRVLVSRTAEASKSQSSVGGGVFTYNGGVRVRSGLNPDELMKDTVQDAAQKVVAYVKPIVNPCRSLSFMKK